MKSDRAELEKACEYYGARMPLPHGISGEALLSAIADVESSFGENAVPRHERAYDYGGRYFSKKLAAEWGSWAACSYGPFQVMFPVFAELGISVTPESASDPRKGALAASSLIICRFLKNLSPKMTSEEVIKSIGDGYNSGSNRDAFVPVEYCDKLWSAYLGRTAPGVAK